MSWQSSKSAIRYLAIPIQLLLQVGFLTGGLGASNDVNDQPASQWHQNIIIRRCTMKDGHGGVVIGSEIPGGCHNVFAEDCSMDSPNLERVLRLKSNAVRGGVIEDLFMRNIKVGQVRDVVLQVDFVYEEGANGPHKPVARNIVMENITVQQTPRVLNVVGFPAL